MLIMALGLAVIFYVTGRLDRQKGLCLKITCCLFSLCTIVGRSFMETGSWDCLISGKVQIAKTFVLLAGYYILYENVILFAGWLLKQMPSLFRREARGKLEKWLFESHTVFGTVLVVWILAIPYLICFFPGSLEPDAWGQIHMNFGVEKLTAHDPVVVTKLMGLIMTIGRTVFKSDIMGIFLYTLLQFGLQSFVIAYVIYVMGRMKAPILMRWVTLAFYAVYPIFPMWGYTMVKDSGYYIFVLLFVAALIHMLYEESAQQNWRQTVLLMMSALGICIFRKDGPLVMILTLTCGIIICKKFRKRFLCTLILCLSMTFLIKVYIKIENIPPSPVREALSVPLQQTARYIREHYEEITPEEAQDLQTFFEVDIIELAELYDPELSDPVKAKVILYPETDEIKAYFNVWWQQFLKHPSTYVQAFINHMYGYICPDKKEGWKGEDIGVFRVYSSETGLDLKYGNENSWGRDLLEGYSRIVKQLPCLGMLYSPGIHTWILLGCILYLTEKRKWRELVVYIPGCFILLICMLSPVNTCVRYSLPLMSLLPLHLTYSLSSTRNAALQQESTEERKAIVNNGEILEM